MEHHDEGTAAREGCVSATWFVRSSALAIGIVLPTHAIASPPVQVPKQTTDAEAPADMVEAPSDDAEAPSDEVDAPSDEVDAPAEDDEPQTAAEWYARGYSLGKEGQNEAAAEAFLRSYELQPTPEALYNAALAHENAKAYVHAIETYQRFLAEPNASGNLVPLAEQSIETLLREVGVIKGVRYEQSRPPRELRVDGEGVELDAFPVMLMPGQIEITVVDEAGTERQDSYELLAGESLLLDIRALLPPPTPEPDINLVEPVDPDPVDQQTIEQAQRDRTRAQRLRSASFAMIGLGGAAGAATLTLGVLALIARRDFNEDTCDGMCPPDFVPGDPEAHIRDYERYALGTTISVGLTAGFAVTALVTGVLSIHYARRAKRVDNVRIRLEPTVRGLAIRF